MLVNATIKFVKVGSTKKTSDSGNSDVFAGVSSVISKNRVRVSHTKKDFFHKNILQKVY